MSRQGALLRKPYTDTIIVLAFFVLAAALRVVNSGDLNPHFSKYPALVIYLAAIIFKINLIWGTWRGFYAGPQSLPDTGYGLALAPEL